MFVVVWSDFGGEPYADYFDKRSKAKRYIKEESTEDTIDRFKLYEINTSNNILIEIKL